MNIERLLVFLYKSHLVNFDLETKGYLNPLGIRRLLESGLCFIKDVNGEISMKK